MGLPEAGGGGRKALQKIIKPLLYINQTAKARPFVECPLVDTNTGWRVFRPFLFYFSNIHLSAIINADTESLENA